MDDSATDDLARVTEPDCGHNTNVYIIRSTPYSTCVGLTYIQQILRAQSMDK